MPQFTLLCLTLYTLASLVVGIRLLVRARRSHGMPELLAGLSYVCAPAIGYPLAIISSQLPNRAVAVPMYVTGEILLVAGCCCFLFFTVKVFRPSAKWAFGMACLGSAIFVYSGFGIVHSFVSYDNTAEITAHARMPLWAMVLVLLFSYIWTAAEEVGS